MEHESAFLITDPAKIAHYLAILLKNKCLLSVCFGDNGDSFITTLFDIDLKKNRLIFYHGPKENTIEQLLGSKKITFKTEHLGIKVAFEAIRLGRIEHQAVSAFAIPIPEAMLWVEARGFFRVKPLAAKPSYCQLALEGQRLISLKLYDISLGGFSMLIDTKEISNLITPDALFEQCKLILADTGEAAVSFQSKRKCVINQENMALTEKIGCQFEQLSPASENTIQRYMQQIERENRQKK
jgi:c-di-GMP-binding flagellar brake protein YcgR